MGGSSAPSWRSHLYRWDHGKCRRPRVQGERERGGDGPAAPQANQRGGAAAARGRACGSAAAPATACPTKIAAPRARLPALGLSEEQRKHIRLLLLLDTARRR
eukprot:5022843-Prymnesium_polylepis.1